MVKYFLSQKIPSVVTKVGWITLTRYSAKRGGIKFDKNKYKLE